MATRPARAVPMQRADAGRAVPASVVRHLKRMYPPTPKIAKGARER